MFRVGLSKDAHIFVPGQEIILGGVHIPHHSQVEAYSDGDVLLHSVCEALYGAMGMEDLGTYFSPKNMASNFDSQIIVEDVLKHLQQNQYQISNIDIQIVVDEPNLKTYKPTIKQAVATKFALELNQVSVKATNTDNTESHKIEVYSVVLIYKGE
ncbi:2-C-methyl-D-erythritol 2,4-cyclodiphosphate synthase [Spiroplasma clarkii]|uniref:2-C-methyl-D-erythritol 2,4-cyclodiphosphate synthase n=1 Tax=Spiroplasma clarkii TaxID=2139 RepID=A0A1Y0KZH2_9MOLU|nr:2-C-methyl-D-erythritol 2,4-cyclodiphosphate synthase [Spiroplasma clarkii]ARU90868.1 2-C-methyl-D-erythritol 2,4-cyclodiphosphate synthase [Spiroplasma clarkii]ATX71655.1 2-C-methyl-D-erythritol 2,4-cyclodiphosphate synthase [Spiroplasma clarkii]